MFTVFKLLWLKEKRPDIWAKTRQYCCFEELLQARLGLRPTISWPLAGRTLLFDVVRHEWSAAILGDLGLRGEQLATPAASGSLVGEIPQSNAAELGLPAGVLVVAGGHDQPCAALGVGAMRTGQAMYATGTVECICPALAQARFTPDLQANNLCTYDYTIPGFYTTVAFSLTGGNILKWFRDEFGQPEIRQAQTTNANTYELLLKAASEAPTRLMVLPHFTPTGTPHFDPDATGAVFGLTLNTRRSEILRALLEGVAFEMRLNLGILAASGIEIRELTATGGGSRSRYWTQLKADVLDKPIRSSQVADAGCLGAAILARTAESRATLAESVAQMVRPGALIEPNQKHARYYTERFALYQRLYPTVKALGLF
jgi:xylulokinase